MSSSGADVCERIVRPEAHAVSFTEELPVLTNRYMAQPCADTSMGLRLMGLCPPLLAVAMSRRRLRAHQYRIHRRTFGNRSGRFEAFLWHEPRCAAALGRDQSHRWPG